MPAKSFLCKGTHYSSFYLQATTSDNNLKAHKEMAYKDCARV